MAKQSKAMTTRDERGGKLAKAKDVRADLERHARDESAREPAGAGGDYISIRGKNFTFKGDALPEPLRVIILNYSFENAFYRGKYDPDDVQPPACFALAMTEDDLAPHDSSPEPQADKCRGCPRNEFGSAENGRGKECKNNRRLVVLNADVDNLTPEYVKKASPALLRLPPTSVKHLRGYVKKLTDGLKLPLFAVVTELSFVEDAEYPCVVPQLSDEIDDRQVLRAIMDKRREIESALMQPFDVSGYGKEKAPPARKPKPKDKPRKAKF